MRPTEIVRVRAHLDGICQQLQGAAASMLGKHRVCQFHEAEVAQSVVVEYLLFSHEYTFDAVVVRLGWVLLYPAGLLYSPP